MINCEHVIVQRVVCYFLYLNFDKLYPKNLTKRLYEEYVRRKVNNAPGVTLRRNFAFGQYSFFFPEKYRNLSPRSNR